MTRFFSFILGLLTVGLSSCSDTKPATQASLSTHQAFDLIGFLDKEAQLLANQKAPIKKTVSEAGQAIETKTINSLNWAEELGSFSEADINRPALKGLYQIDSTSNATGDRVFYYRAKEGADAIVQLLSYSLNRQGQLLQLNAVLQQENFLFTTNKHLYLEAQPGQGPHLRLYQMEERQKLLFMNPEEYGIVGEVML